MTHRNAKLTFAARLTLVERVKGGWTHAQVAAGMGVSRATVGKWTKRYREEGPAGLSDRSSKPHRSPRALPEQVVAEVCRLRMELGCGPHRIAWMLGLAASTVYAVLKRAGLSLLTRLDRTTREVIRYEKEHPGELVHLDVKKLGRIPDGGGKRFADGFQENQAGYSPAGKRGHDFIHVAVDDHSRFAYVEALPDERGETTVGFLRRMDAAFRAAGIPVAGLLTDNGSNYRSGIFRQAAAAMDIRHHFTRPYRPQTNGKAEAYIKTIQREWAYRRQYLSNGERLDELSAFVHLYNHHRPHTSIGNRPPSSRLPVNNLCGKYT